MHIPFSAPDVPELSALPVGERAQIMRRYVTSGSAKRLIRLLQASIFLSLVFLLFAVNLSGTWRIIFAVAVPISLVFGVAVYRIGATRALRKLLQSA